MGAVERGECQRWALDNKLTCFGVSFDGQAAFPSVDRDIQVRELYSVGERGDYLQYSKNTYKKASSQIKSEGKLSREFHEFRGSRQGHAILAKERGTDPRCRICSSTTYLPAPTEDIIHILTHCRGTADTRQRMIPNLLNTVHMFFPDNQILQKQDH